MPVTQALSPSHDLVPGASLCKGDELDVCSLGSLLERLVDRVHAGAGRCNAVDGLEVSHDTAAFFGEDRQVADQHDASLRRLRLDGLER